MERRLGDERQIAGDYQYRALHHGPRIQRAWHRIKLAILDDHWAPRAGERVLDVGCGSGVFADAMAQRGAEVLGVDGNEEALRFALATWKSPGLAFRKGLVDELDLPSASFDAVVCLEVIEHVHLPQVRTMFGSFHRLLKPGGTLVVSTPNYRGTWPLVEWVTDRFGGGEKMHGLQHVTHFHRRMLKDELSQTGFPSPAVRTMSTFAPFAAALSWGLYDALRRCERRVDLPFGNILLGIAQKP